MSYRCQLCNTAVPPKTRALRVILETRTKYYPYRAKANPGFQTKNGQILRPLRKSRKKGDRIDDPGGRGKEIVKEVLVCKSCLESAT